MRSSATTLSIWSTVFRSGGLILGDSGRGFAEKYAAYHGVPHCVGVDDGTNVVKLGLQVLESARVTR
jgi:dTDP-3-amino-2,3,6-trideoxy-4-keto-D-glucose/dTDP-3-amino-3,4,6-trideoxy-alpha-D-glucose/dTDP-2,6-dideoxy-D-kanosamine transaminase